MRVPVSTTGFGVARLVSSLKARRAVRRENSMMAQ